MENGTKRDQGRERRRDTRHPLQTRIALKTDKAIFFMESLDISTTGIRVESQVGIEVGTRCRLIPFFDDVARLFEADGTVVRVQEIPGEKPMRLNEPPRAHVGIEFDVLNPAELEALLGILKTADVDPARPAVVRM